MRISFLLFALCGLLVAACDTTEPNAPPTAPHVIRGADSAAVDQRVEVLITADDPAGLTVTYEVDWGDGRATDFHADIESGLWFTIAHHYFEPGRFSMRCRAINAAGRVSAWSAPWTITVTGDAVTGRGDWWMFMRDAQHSGHSPYVGPSTPILKWKLNAASPIRSSVAFDAAGNLHFGSDDFTVRAMYPDGATRWIYNAGLARIRNTPALHHDGSVAFGSTSANIYLLDNTGAKRWNFSVASPVTRSNSVRDEEGNIYIGSTDHALYSLRPDGMQRWRFATGGSVEGSPALARDGNTVYIGSRDWIVYALSTGGTPRWNFVATAPVSGSVSVGPNGEILFGDEGGWLHSLRPDGSLAWRKQLNAPIRTTPAVTRDAMILVITSQGTLFKLDNEGNIVWDLSLAQSGGEGSPAVDVNGVVYVGTPDGHLNAVSAEGKHLWRFEAADAVHSTPAIGPDGSIAFGSDDGWLYVLRDR